jgi:hypothetical protein
VLNPLRRASQLQSQFQRAIDEVSQNRVRERIVALNCCVLLVVQRSDSNAKPLLGLD